MKKITPFLFISIFVLNTMLHGQVTIYSQDFNAGFGSWTNTNLAAPWGNITDGFGLTNIWQASDAESGRNPNVCGVGGAGNPSLFMGADAMSSGAAYSSTATTNRRISSPNINTTGFSNLTLSFNYIGNGFSTRDKAYLQYSVNGGTSWISPAVAPTSATPAMGAGGNLNNLKSQLCGGGQGLWTNITWTLPATCENISNLRIAFVWQNNDAGSPAGSAVDPSFAVDNITITYPGPVPIELLYFNGERNDNVVDLQWVTLSEINNDYFTIERSVNHELFEEIGRISGAGNSNEPIHYNFTDPNAPPGTCYYRLRQTDLDGAFTYSNSIVFNSVANWDISAYPNPVDDLLFVELSGLNETPITIELHSVLGEVVYREQRIVDFDSGTLSIPTKDIQPGMMVLRIVSPTEVYSRKIVISH